MTHRPQITLQGMQGPRCEKQEQEAAARRPDRGRSGGKAESGQRERKVRGESSQAPPAAPAGAESVLLTSSGLRRERARRDSCAPILTRTDRTTPSRPAESCTPVRPTGSSGSLAPEATCREELDESCTRRRCRALGERSPAPSSASSPARGQIIILAFLISEPSLSYIDSKMEYKYRYLIKRFETKTNCCFNRKLKI